MNTEMKLEAAAIEAAIRAEVDHVRQFEEPETARWPDDYEAAEVAAMRARMRAVISAYLAVAQADAAQSTCKDCLQVDTLARSCPELSGNTGELRELVAQTIRNDGSDFDDVDWNALSDERKKWWLEDADRVLAVIKDFLITASPAAPAPYKKEKVPEVIVQFVTTDGNITGSQFVPVRSVRVSDDGTQIDVDLDYWPSTTAPGEG